MSSEPEYSDFEKGERQALLQVRSFITKHGTKEVADYCAQRLHDMKMDALHRRSAATAQFEPAPVALQIRATAATPLRGTVRYRSSDGAEYLVEGEIGKGIRVPPGATILNFGLLSAYRRGDASPPGHSIPGHLPNPPK